MNRKSPNRGFTKPFEIMDISGDAGVRAYGVSIEETFINAALGMYSLITNPDGIKEADNIVVEVEGIQQRTACRMA